MSGLICGLTLRHPWAWCFLKGKDVENRTWRPERQGGRVGMFLALHGGAMPPARSDYWDEINDAVMWIGQRGLACAPEARELLKDGRGLCIPGIVAVGQLVEVRQDSPSPWAVPGAWHWGLNVTPLPESVPHRGAQGLFTLDPAALVQVRRLYRMAREVKNDFLRSQC